MVEGIGVCSLLREVSRCSLPLRVKLAMYVAYFRVDGGR